MAGGYNRTYGYMPRTFDETMDSIRVRLNEYWETNYSYNEFVGTNVYKVAYPIVQDVMSVENNLSEIFSKYADFIDGINESINAPAVVRDNIIRKVKELGIDCSLKQISEEEAGKIFLCCDITREQEDYPFLADKITEILQKNTAYGTISQGDQVITRQLENGQVEDFKFELAKKTAIKVKLELKISRNNTYYIPTDDEAKEILLKNFKDLYHLGNDFEPEKYAEINRDFPSCAEVILSYSLNGGTSYTTDVAQLPYNTKYTIAKEDITIVKS